MPTSHHLDTDLFNTVLATLENPAAKNYREPFTSLYLLILALDVTLTACHMTISSGYSATEDGSSRVTRFVFRL